MASRQLALPLHYRLALKGVFFGTHVALTLTLVSRSIGVTEFGLVHRRLYHLLK